MRDKVAAADVNFVFERDGDGLRCKSGVEVAVEGMDALDAACASGRQSDDSVARCYRSGSDLTGEAAEILIGANDALHWKTKSGVGKVLGNGDTFQVLEESRPVIPGCLLATGHDVVAK